MYIADFMTVSLFPDPDPQLELLALSEVIILSLICLYHRPPSSGSHIFDTLGSYFDLICVNSFKIYFYW